MALEERLEEKNELVIELRKRNITKKGLLYDKKT